MDTPSTSIRNVSDVTMSKWDNRFLELAEMVSSWSKDPSTKVGAVITDGKHVVSVGFNGFPPNCEDKEEWLNDRPTKYKLVIHAEVNAIANANRSLRGTTLYSFPLCPCGECAKHIAVSGISRVVSLTDKTKTSTPTIRQDGNPSYLSDEAAFVFQANGIEYLNIDNQP